MEVVNSTIPTILVGSTARHCAETLANWRPQRDLNPRYRRERAQVPLTFSGSYGGAYYFSY
jgi:hypothetical protein